MTRQKLLRYLPIDAKTMTMRNQNLSRDLSCVVPMRARFGGACVRSPHADDFLPATSALHASPAAAR